ncbi:MAG TPA: hypothetical protein VLW85_14170, partial [Myxococcales bacterium]|nr:hypothetical protein [Myxococcales bacterium]
MIENSKKLVFRLVTLVALAAAGCSVSASGEIPCVDDSSCPSDYPVCTAGKCVAGTSTSAATVAIVGVQGHAASDILSGSITIAVTARATSGVSSVTLAAGSKTYQADKTSAPPIYYFIVPTTDLSNADVSVTATVTAGDGTTASSPGFTIHVDNAAPTLTITLIGSADVADGSMAKFDVSANEALASITGTVSGTGSGPLSEISPASGNVHHFGYAVTAADAAGLHNVSFTAVDLAGNSTPASMSNAFNVHHPFAFASLTVSTGLSQVAGFPAAKTGTLVTISATLPSSVAFAASATPVFKLTSANSGPTRTLTPTKTASPPNDTWTATYTVVSGDHDGLALVTADATDIAANVAPTRSATLNIGQTAPVISSINVTPANS